MLKDELWTQLRKNGYELKRKRRGKERREERREINN